MARLPRACQEDAAADSGDELGWLSPWLMAAPKGIPHGATQTGALSVVSVANEIGAPGLSESATTSQTRQVPGRNFRQTALGVTR